MSHILLHSLLQTGSTITEKEQLLCNTQNDIICHDTFMPFHQPGTGRQYKIKLVKFMQKLIPSILFGKNTKCKGFLT